MSNNSNILIQITRELIKAGVEKIILFGSTARGEESEQSDIDLIVVAPVNNIPSNFREKMDLYLSYNQYVKPFREQIPIDIMVYTRAGYRKFLDMDSMFAREIQEKGKVLYEAGNKGVA